MEGSLSGDDVPSVGTDVLDAPLTGDLDHSLVGLSAGVLIEDLIHTGGLADLLGQDDLGNGVGIVEGLHQGSALLLNGSDNLGVAVAQGVNGDTSIEVQIGLVVLVIHIDALAPIGQEIHTLIGLDLILLGHCLHVGNSQASVFQSHDEIPPIQKLRCKIGISKPTRKVELGILNSRLLNPPVLNQMPENLFFNASPVTCDYNNTNFPKMKCTFCTNYSRLFLAKTPPRAQDFMHS